MRTHYPLQTLLKVFAALSLLFAVALLARPTSTAVGRSLAGSTIVTWTGRGGDARWSNSANWDAGRMPGPADIARFTASSSSARVDPLFGNVIAGLKLEAGYRGVLQIDRPLHITGDLSLQGGTLEGGSAVLFVKGAVKVGGGMLITPRAAMQAGSMDIAAPGVVRLGLNGSLSLAGDGTPLTGNGLLDVTTNRPNVVQYTGRSTSSLSAAGPAIQLRAARVDKQAVQLRVAVAAAASRPSLAGPQAPEFSPASSVTFTSTDQSNLAAAVIDPTNHFAYFGTNTSPGAFVVKVDLSPANFHEVGFVSLPPDVALITSGAIDPLHNYAYFGATDISIFSGGRVVKVNVAPASFAYVGTLNLPNAGGNEDSLTSAVADPALDSVYFGTSTLVGTVIEVGLGGTGAPVYSGTITLPAGEDNLTSAVIDTTSHIAYFGATDINTTGNSHIVKVALSPTFTRTGGLTLTGITNLNAGVIDAANDLAYFAASSANPGIDPAAVIKIRLSNLTQAGGTLQPFSIDRDRVGAGVIDLTSGNLYFAASDASGTLATEVAKVQLSTFTTAQVITLTAAETPIGAGVIDPANHYAYFGMNTSPGIVSRVLLDNSQTTVSASANPSVFGQSVTFTATVTALVGSVAPTGKVTFTLDSGASVARTLIAAGATTSTAALVTTTLSVGPHTILASYGGDGTFTPASGSINQTVNPATTSVSVGASTNPSVYGQPITFTATVTAVAPGAGTPTGVVTFTLDSTTNVTAILNASRVATYATSTLTVAPHPIVATYGGDPSFIGSTSGSLNQVVNKASTATSVTSAPNPAVFGQSVTFTATVAAVAPGVGAPTGIVTFTIEGAPVAVAASGGVATYVASTLAVGTHPVSAAYGGDANFNSSTGALTPNQTVNKASTTATITSDLPDPSVTGESVTVTFTVAVNAPGAGTPTGVVTVTDGIQSCGAVLPATSCSLAFSTATAKTLTAQYGGEANFNGSTSTTAPHTVNKAGTAITLTTSAPSPSFYLQPVTFTFTLGVDAPGTGTPTGVVTIADGTQSCTAVLPAGSCAIAFNSVGAKSLTATYSGDGSFNSATSAAFAHTVNARPPVANDDVYTVRANNVLSVAATGVLSNDLALNGRPITSTLFSGPLTGTLAFSPNGSFVFTPAPFFNGIVTYTYQANDAGWVSNAATVTITVLPVNQPPSFTPGPDITVFTSTQFITDSWATHISPGPANESGQTVAFTVTTDNPNLFQIPPALSPAGTLSFKPAPFYAGTALATVFAQDNGGTANGGVDTSPSITFTIVISSDPDVPINIVPGPQSTFINVPRVFSSATGNAISITDPDAVLLSEVMSVTLSATQGTLRLGSLAGLNVTPTSGVGSVVSFSGLITPTNDALAGLIFTPTLGFVGAAGIVIETQDLGHFGEPASFVVANPIDISVLDSPIGSLTALNSSPTRLDDTTFFTATAAGTNVVYTWNFGDDSSIGSGADVTHPYALSGTYTAIVTATNTFNSLSASTTVTITNQPPVAAAADSAFSLGSVATLDGSRSSDPDNHLPLTYFWAQTGGSPPVSFTPDVSVTTFTAPPSPAVLTFTLVVTDAHGLPSLPKTVTITIANIPITGLAAQNSSPTVIGSSTQFTATVTAGSSAVYVWNFGDGITKTGQYVAHAYAAPGNYPASVTATNQINSASAATPVTIDKATPTVSITGHTPNPSGVGQSVAITFSITANAPGAGSPTGVVTVTDGTQNCVATLPTASCNMAFTTGGVKTLTAQYSGDANFTDSASSSVTHTVNPANPANTTTRLASAPNPSVFGQSVTFTATVTASGPGAGTPGGTVTLTIDGTSTAIALSGGAATYVTSTLTVGSHAAGAAYSGDGNFASSASSPYTQVVSQYFIYLPIVRR